MFATGPSGSYGSMIEYSVNVHQIETLDVCIQPYSERSRILERIAHLCRKENCGNTLVACSASHRDLILLESRISAGDQHFNPLFLQRSAHGNDRLTWAT